MHVLIITYHLMIITITQAKDVRKAQPTAAQKTKEEGDDS